MPGAAGTQGPGEGAPPAPGAAQLHGATPDSLSSLDARQDSRPPAAQMLDVCLHVASRPGFFEPQYRIHCDVLNYCAYPDADLFEGVREAMQAELIHIGKGIGVSVPVKVETKLRKGLYIHATLSHEGVLAICSIMGNKHEIELTDLKTNNQCLIPVEETSSAAFYDDKIIVIVSRFPLRECKVSEAFRCPNSINYKELGDVKKISSNLDTSLLHATRTLLYKSMDFIPYKYNVDTGENIRILKDLDVWSFGCMTGIDAGVEGVFRAAGDDSFTYGYARDGTAILLSETKPVIFYNKPKQTGPHAILSNVLPSMSHPADLRKAMRLYSNGCFYVGADDDKSLAFGPFEYQGGHSIVRLFKDIYLAYDHKKKYWVLVRIDVP